MAIGISIREFARRAGCDDKVVRRKVKSEHIHLLKDGSIDPSYLNVDWRSGDPLPVSASSEFADTGADIDGLHEGAFGMVSADGKELWSRADAEKVKENYAARLKQLEFDRESALVVTVDDTAKHIVEEFGIVRQRCRRIGADVAPRLAVMTSAAEIKALIDEAVVQALADLSGV